VSAVALPIPRRGISIGDVIRWAFGVATVVTNKGKAMFADRLRTSPGTFTTSPKFLAMGTGATGAARTAVVGDTALSTEVETRTSGTESTVTTSVTNDTYQVTGTQTATAERKVDEAGCFDASTVGNMAFSATLAVDTLLSSDTITWTWKVQQS
jgi:hypothetical protein